MKIYIHKVKHWEYWSVKIVYFVSFILWLLFILRFLRIHFYRFSNPSIKNGGLYDDSKFEIYKLLPKKIYPKTVLITNNEHNNIDEILKLNQFEFPLIVKPDIGLRGINVEKVNNISDINTYKNKVQQNFLIQEIINFPNEIGLFYCRFPNQKNGTITGLTIKNFLTIKGNGKDTLIDLMKQNPRHEMQIDSLKSKFNLLEILKKDETRCLVPFGNHNRGTEFIDGKANISPKLVSTFDEILKNVNGFYYGRLDIRFNTFEELEQGINFSIIELNGAKSEPTHIYDPKHSFWFGQKEILRHQMIFYQIIKQNIKFLKV